VTGCMYKNSLAYQQTSLTGKRRMVRTEIRGWIWSSDSTV